MKIFFAILKILVVLVILAVAVAIGVYFDLPNWNIFQIIPHFISRIFGASVALLLAPVLFQLIEKVEKNIK